MNFKNLLKMFNNIPVVILCGGYGTRISEETQIKPKPMVSIGNKPILIHIMNIYRYYGFNEFILALGYKSHYIKNFFSKKIKTLSLYTPVKTPRQAEDY